MKTIFEDKKKFYVLSIILFFVTSLLIKILLSNIGEQLTYIVFPIYFLVLTILYLKNNKIDWSVPIILTTFYLFISYILLTKDMSALKVVLAFFSSYIPIYILKLRSKDKKDKIRKEKLKERQLKEENSNKKTLISSFLPLLSMVILEFYYSICTFGVTRIPITFIPTIIGIILTYSIYLVILAIFRRTDRAIITFSIIFLVIFIINEGRIYYTSDTLLLTDVLFLQNAGEVALMANVTFFYCLNYLLFPTILTIIYLLYVFKIAKKNNIRICNTKKMLIESFIALCFLLLLFIPIKPLDKFLVTNGYNIYDGKDLTITASNTRYFYRYGVLPGIYGKLIEAQRYAPDGYNEEELMAMLNNTNKIKFSQDVTPNYHKLKEKYGVEMISPSYGGMSSNVEFEILTGGSLNFFSKGYTPYMQLFTKGVSNNNPSIIKELNKNGYKTKVLNSSSKNMFNCDAIYDIYEVKERNHLYDEIDLGGKYVTDAYLTDQIIDYFNNKDKDEKVFFFTITMGGHMPYYEGKYDKYDIDIVDSPYDSNINEIVKSYAEGIYLADKELGRIYDYINTLDEDTIVLFFGDHLPHLALNNGQDALFSTNYLQDDYNLESVYKQYNTTALVFSNYNIDLNGTKYLSPDLLLTYVINNMDLELSPFYRWLYTTKDILPSSNFVVSQDSNGKLYYTLGLEDKMKEMFELRRKVQYMLFK